MTRSKKCFKCEKILPFEQFYKHSAMGDGYLNKCKECAKIDVRANRLKNVDYYRAYDLHRSKTPERREAIFKNSNSFRQKDPRIMKCHGKVGYALKTGRLQKSPCIICGSEKSVAHHESYSCPLDVVWYCQPHHKERHKEMVRLGLDPLKEHP